MIRKYRKKPVEVEAVQYTGSAENLIELLEFTGQGDLHYNPVDNTIVIETLEGNMIASLGDFIIKGVSGEFYPCKPDIFKITYDPVS